jgi:3-deoxy-D-manno-octulosonic-acid transferase/heptosyltransferase-1
MNILIVKLSAIGDVIHTLPAANAIRVHYPNAHITWLVEEAAYPLVANHPAIDRVLLSKRKRWIKNFAFREIIGFIRQLRDTRYDIVIDFQALLKSGVLTALARGKRKIGFDKGMEHAECSHIFFNERVPPVSMELHALLRYMRLLAPLGIESDCIEYRLPIQDRDRRTAEKLLTLSTSPLIAINPVAKWETKLWQNEKFAQLADLLTDKHQATIFFTGAPEDRQTIDDIQSQMKHASLNLAGRTSLMELAALYEKADVLISTDTGPMHLGAAVGIPVVALFGPTAPWRTGPFGLGHQIIRSSQACSPCFKRKCPTIACMKEILPEQVLAAVEKVI